MGRGRTRVFRLVWLVPILAACYPMGRGGDGGVGPCPEVIEIRGFAFHPQSCFVSSGSSVRFVNQDAAPHTATSQQGAPASFDTGVLNQGQTSAPIVLNAKGSYSYFCRIHPSMQGQIEVR